MNYDYDVIVAGAGVAGSLAAASAAKNGAKTLLLDRNDETEPGKKTNWGWVCGDAVAKAHIDFVEKELGIKFASPELDSRVDRVYAHESGPSEQVLFRGRGVHPRQAEDGQKARQHSR